MAFSEILVRVSPNAKLPKGVTEKKFCEAAEPIQETILHHLPDDFVLDKLGRTELVFGPSGDEPRYLRRKDRSICFVEDFDFAAWKKAKAADRDQILFEATIERLVDIGRAFRADLNVLNDTKKQIERYIKKNGFGVVEGDLDTAA